MNCIECDTLFEPKRKTAQFCSPYCRVKYNRKKAAEEGDSSVVWDGSECATNTEPAPKSKKPSASHVVQLKERTKERIRKAQGHSSTPKTELPQGPDAPPFLEKLKKTSEEMIASGKWKGINSDACLDDATAGLPPEALPETRSKGYDKFCQSLQDAAHERQKEIEQNLDQPPEHSRRLAMLKAHVPLPVEHHGHQNDLAKSVISKVPTPKLDPNSDEAELARLQKSQLRTAKKKD
jgi:hypothetical protein